jgi:phosphoglycerate kinase
LKPVAYKLTELLHQKVEFIDEPVGMDVLNKCKTLNPGEIVLLENTRFCDFPEKLESSNDLNLAKYWSTLGDVFVCDAFGSLHRLHSSVAGISKYLPSYFGLLVKEEIAGLAPIINPQRPFAVFMGGAKIDDKLPYIEKLLPEVDYLLIGGGIANSFLYACGYDVGDSLCTKDEDILNLLKEWFTKYRSKIIMPIDFAFDDKAIMDLGPKSIAKYQSVFEICKTIFINGSCGKFETERFAKGTVDLFASLKNIKAYKVAGGGDTLNVINKYHLNASFSFLSSGGGASLEYVSNKNLTAIDYINKE